MERYFNTEGACNPKKHYMVDITPRLKLMKERYVERGSYFVINRGRQYGKTTTLMALREYLKEEYIVLPLDFQMLGNAKFETEHIFAGAFANYLQRTVENPVAPIEGLENPIIGQMVKEAREDEMFSLDELFASLSRLCYTAKKPIVLLIDEVDSAANHQVFLDFLAQLRAYYLKREELPIFQSVILAGVYDIKNLKTKIRPNAEHKYNSPWNIAADFPLRMSFSESEIAGMLAEYEDDHAAGMDVEAVAHEIYVYTSGYPYLVSFLCKLLDERIPETEEFQDRKRVWSREGVREAVKIVQNSRASLFDSMTRQLDEHPEMKQMLREILFQGLRIPYSSDNHAAELAEMFGYITNKDGSIRVSNRIFEMRLYNLFISEEVLSNAIYDRAQANLSQFFRDGRLDMVRVLEKFVEYFTEIYGDNDEGFLEKYGRKFFLLYLKPIINGTGNYYIEAQTRDARRTDVIVDYRGEQFVIEMKIWHGNEYNERAEEQLAGYLDAYRQKRGYLISFNFNRNKTVGVRTVSVGERTIVEAVV